MTSQAKRIEERYEEDKNRDEQDKHPTHPDNK